MNFTFIRKGVAIATLVSVMLAPARQILAAKGTSTVTNTTVENTTQDSTGQEIQSKSIETAQSRETILDKVFINIEKIKLITEENVRFAAEQARIAAEQARIAAEKEASRQKGLEVVNYAKQFIGNPYVYGGTSLTKGTDCSGFVMSVYAHFGISLPHSSYSMRSVGYKVSLSEIQPGDIVCFPGHVGIYAGDDTVVNAVNEKRGIRVSNLYARQIITVRRIF